MGSAGPRHDRPQQAPSEVHSGAGGDNLRERNLPPANLSLALEPAELDRMKIEALDAAPMTVLIIRRDGVIVWANPAVEQLTGYPPEELLGETPRVFKSGRQTDGFYAEMWRTICAGRRWQGELMNRRKDGSLYHEFQAIMPFRNPRGEISHFICVKKDIDKRKAAEEALRNSDELFRQVTENIREIFFVYALEPPRLVYVSPAYEQIWGRIRAEVYQRPSTLADTIHPDDRERVLGAFQDQHRGKPSEIEFRILRPEGAMRWVRIRTFPVHDQSGRFFRLVGIGEDISTRKNAEVESLAAQDRLNLELVAAGERERDNEKLTGLVDMIQCCPTGEQAFRIIEEVLGSMFPACGGVLYLLGPSREAEAAATWGEGALAEKVFRPQDCWALRRGKVHVVADAKSAMRCGHSHAADDAGQICIPLVAHGETLGLLHFQYPLKPPGAAALHLGAATRLAEQATVVGERLSLALANLQLRELLGQQSVRDPLTGLFNRRYMEETLDRELTRAQRRNEIVAVGICDLDRFKDFNDIFGHEAGDLLLREVAGVLKASVRQADIVCRMGGEEFVIILPGASVEIARERLTHIRQHVQALSLSHRGRPLGRVTISAGLAGFPKDGATPEDVLRAADRALYRAKNEGRNLLILAS